MCVVVNPLAPCVQNGKEADLDAEVLRISCDFQKGFRDGTKKYAVDNSLVLKCYRAELVRKRKDDVEISCVEEVSNSVFEPLRPGCTLALRAVAVPAGFVEELLVTAVITPLHVTAESSGSADRDVS
jgi:hypothetical protein